MALQERERMVSWAALEETLAAGDPLPLLSTGEATHGVLCPVTGLTRTKRASAKSREGSWRWLWDWSISHMRKGWKRCNSLAHRKFLKISEGNLEGRWSHMLFWWCPVTRQEAQTETWEVPYGNQEMLFWLWRWLSTGTRCPEQLWNLPRDIQKPSGHGPEQLALGVSPWVGGWDQMNSRGHFQPQPVRDSEL